jgi:hypothetical protein
MDETDTPLQRPAKYATQELFTEAQRTELDAQRAALGGKDNRRELSLGQPLPSSVSSPYQIPATAMTDSKIE